MGLSCSLGGENGFTLRLIFSLLSEHVKCSTDVCYVQKNRPVSVMIHILCHHKIFCDEYLPRTPDLKNKTKEISP